ncbi:hypothetical protein Dsin_006766 [Dipteronia sinensis]|uniref:Cholesterol oxidase n=1 Tax=Dipteronia sinensis TaxID=43782 RepID=A0AAE0B0D3_9ROSI|nr:hypothetical protein Dsin_006766 [Dipteronia sinensis]
MRFQKNMEKQANIEQRFGEEDGYDAVVVGSGYGGSAAAFRMSMAGIKVCIVEKGRRWESHDFPTDSLKIMSAFRMENRNIGVSFGPKDALLQVYEQGDSVAAVACGLGGGSLVNAGVMMPTPVRARRNPKWPKDWEGEWNSCEASAATMLRIQSVPVRFPNAKVVGDIAIGEIEDCSEDSIKLSINFDLEEPLSSQQMGSCLACGNCLAGCPYNAKNSTDKNYILSAIQAGCIVKTECQVQFVVKNPYDSFQEGKTSRKRRWLVYLNEIDYITSDFVVLSAGVLGSTEILFQSQMRGLRLSETLGSGVSCNGNTVAYLAGSPAPLNAYGLDGKQLPKKIFQERPGPAISSSYTSSLGFTIQTAVLPTAYPFLLFKGIITYGWPNGCWFFHGIIDKLKHLMGIKSSQAMVLNAMGYDESDGKIMFQKDTYKIHFTPPQDPLFLRKIKAFQKLTKKLGGILFMSRYRSTSVHLLGGCNASSDPSHGVCNSKGQVFDTEAPATVHPGLYVCDASLIPCSVGINPSLTIAAAAEHVSRHLVKDVLEYKSKRGIPLLVKTVDQHSCLTTDKNSRSGHKPVIVFKETMKGYIGGMPCTAYLKMKMNSQNRKNFDEGNSVNGESHPFLRGKVGGYVVFKSIEKDELHVIDGEIDLCAVDYRTPYTQYMHYRLLLVASSGSRYILEGRKIMHPFLFALYAWRETTTLHVTFNKLAGNKSQDEMINLIGELRISMTELLKSLMSLEGNKRRFIYHLSQTLLRTYILQIPRGSHKDCSLSNSYQKPYPDSTLHEIKTEDGYIISCRQWKCSQAPQRSKGEKQPKLVLLLNGHSTESYWLPTEPNDLVRTLLEEGYEPWLLQSRLHPINPANNFTIEDIGKFDIPAAITKILEFYGESTKVHVVAHCVGGLAIHMALLGGHVSATHIASLSCTNSSMYFKLNALPMLKMWFPVLPVSMAILGKNKVLPLLKTAKTSLRHCLLKCIARLIPRYERCTCNECEVFSGIFGNTFWHQNVSPTMHSWLNMQSSTRLPMATFPHLRKISKAGFIVDSNGKNSYLIHPERMEVSTLYISGGRNLLVTPETSFLANKYMKLHQPGLRHERVVVEGFGHSDLLIGEESHKKVFAHILSHIRLAEQGENVVMSSGKICSAKALAWADDPYGEDRGFGSLFSPSLIVFLMLLWLLVLISLFI